MTKKTRWTLFVLGFAVSHTAHSAPLPSGGLGVGNAQGLARPLNGGIVYPSLYGSIDTNPSGLTHDPKTVLQLEWAPPSRPSPSGSLTEGFAYGNSAFGFGANVAGSLQQGNVLTLTRSTLAAAVGVPGASIGANVSFDFAGGTGADVDIGIAVVNVSGIQLTLLLTSIQAFKTVGALNFGIGITSPRKYQIEGSWSYTPFSQLAQNILSADAIGYIGILGLGIYASSTSNVNGSSIGAGVGGSLNVTGRVILGARAFYDTSLGTSYTMSGTCAF